MRDGHAQHQGRLESGPTVVIHCKGGLGRTGMSAAASCVAGSPLPLKKNLATIQLFRVAA
jgi:protein-tyrosine phosphatase